MNNKEIYAINTDTETYSFNAFHENTGKSVCGAIKSCNRNGKTPIIVCIGSDLVLGDSLGPLVGTMLLKKKICAYVYGTLSAPITAKEILCAKTHLKMLHPDSFVIAIDAAV